jgi:hypothetical protein
LDLPPFYLAVGSVPRHEWEAAFGLVAGRQD